jgi:hypothetical protein
MAWVVHSISLTNILPLLFKRFFVFWKSVTYRKFGVMNRPFGLERQRNVPPNYDKVFGFGTTLSVLLTTARFRMSKGKWLYFINSCVILKSSHYHWMQPWGYRLNIFLSEVRNNSGKLSRITALPVLQVFLLFIGWLYIWPSTTKGNDMEWDRDFRSVLDVQSLKQEDEYHATPEQPAQNVTVRRAVRGAVPSHLHTDRR